MLKGINAMRYFLNFFGHLHTVNQHRLKVFILCCKAGIPIQGLLHDLSKYSLIIHCGGCMLNEREMKYRLACAKDQDIPMTNYGIAIAYMQ